MSRVFSIDDTCTFYVNTHTPGTGAAVDADAAPGYRIYEDETATPILTGTMALLDDANTVGFYSEQITISAANGFEQGKSYVIRKTLVVGGVTGVQLEYIQVRADVTLTAAERNALADAILIRNASNVEATAGQHSLCGVILAMTENLITGTTLTIYRTDGTTTFATKTLTTDPAAEPITGIA